MRRILPWSVCMLLVVDLLALGLVACKEDSTVKPLAKQAKDDAATSKSAQTKVFTVDLGGGVNLEMVLIPGGTFEMGSNSGYSSERPVHNVTITKPLYMGKYEVTQEQWEAVMGNNPSRFKGAKNPVERVSWNDCQEFAKKINEKHPGKRFRLPTEAEWEYACRAGSTGKWCFGDDETALPDHAWYFANSDRKTHPVGQKKPNAWGLYDMHGNVLERCADWYATEYPDGSLTDPTGPASGQFRVCRGGCWYNTPSYCRSADRSFYYPSARLSLIGFRLSRTP